MRVFVSRNGNMHVVGFETVYAEFGKPGYFVKMILNGSGAVFFPGTTEHRTIKAAGLSYDDNYKGNAMAGIITDGRIEIRKHSAFPIARVASIIKELLEAPQLCAISGFRVTYQGKLIREARPG